MGYYIYLSDPVTKSILDIPRHLIRGGTYEAGGSTKAYLNITYNYAEHYYRVIDAKSGIRAIYGKTGAESIPILKSAIDQLDDETSDDYWKSTEGNAKQALCGLLAFAQIRPDGVWYGD